MANRDPQEAVDLVVTACGEYSAKFRELFASGAEPHDIGLMINSFYEALGDAVDPDGMAELRAQDAARREREKRVIDELLNGL